MPNDLHAHNPETAPCVVCGRTLNESQMRSWASVRPGVSELVHKEYPQWEEGRYICKEDLAHFRRLYVEDLLEEERGELSELDREVLDSFESGEIISENPEETIAEEATFGERMADHVASFGGSWTFILLFSMVLFVWMAINSASLVAQPFDPYPYILLNLVLSTIAAIQAPIIMMSQKRQETKDRLRAENDYRINLKAELEIRQLHEKLDIQMARQWEKLAELQRIQIEALEETVANPT